MTRKRDELLSELEKLAQKIAAEALMEGVTINDRLDAMKTLTAFWVGTRKIKGKAKDDDGDEGVIDFNTMRTNLRTTT